MDNNPNFQTIESILKQKEVGTRKDYPLEFPDY